MKEKTAEKEGPAKCFRGESSLPAGDQASADKDKNGAREIGKSRVSLNPLGIRGEAAGEMAVHKILNAKYSERHRKEETGYFGECFH